MDSLSQIALGASVSHLVLGRRIGRRALLIGAVLGTLPDLDVLVRYDDAVDSFTRHRGWSHSLFVLTAVSPLIALALRRWLARAASLQRCCLAVWLVLTTHALLDAFTVYGTQLYWPLDVAPVAWGSLFIIDPLYTLPLLVGIVLAARRRRHSARHQRRPGRRAVAAGLIISTAYIGWSLVAQQRALDQATATLAGQQANTESVLAIPLPFSLLWRILVIDDAGYREAYYSLLDPPGDITFSLHARGTDRLEALAAHAPVPRLRWFTGDRVRAEARDGVLVLTDLRIGAESNYVFEFAVAELDGSSGVMTPMTSRALSPSIDPAIALQVWRRMWDPSVALAPPSTRAPTPLQ